MAPLFVLVHGGQQGPWAFDRLIPELGTRGHRAIAVDLPVGDLEAGAADYADVVTRQLEGLDDDVVLVGHSMGGLVTPLVAVRRPVSRLVFICAAYPEPGRSHLDVRANQPGESVAAGPSSAWEQPGDAHVMRPEIAREMFFHDCPPEVQDWALARLRLQARRPLREVTPLEAWPATPRTLIIATDDRCIPRDSALRTARRLFGVTPLELPGGHCPMLSRPDHVAELLIRSIS